MNVVKIKSGIKKGEGRDLETMREENVREGNTIHLLTLYFVVDNLIVDAMSMQYLSGSVIGYKTSLMGEQFEIKNPQAQSKCGCGSSFAV
jgi:iron-sulfur cluster assembly accessory protein